MVLVIKRRHILAAILCVAILLLLPIAASFTPAAEANGRVENWGLSFQKEGEPPEGNATAAELAEYNAWYVGSGDEKVIYLTFDAGFENGCTPPILDALKKHNAPAAFFLVGNYLETAPELVRRMVAEGHTVANHTYHHPDMSAIRTKEAFAAELSATEAKFKEITGKDMPKFYRPPQGKYSTDNLQMAKELGYTTVFWSLAYVDWYQNDQPTADAAFQKLLPRIHNGAVVLLHSTSQTNAAILDELLGKWEQQGYRFGSLDELVKT